MRVGRVLGQMSSGVVGKMTSETDQRIDVALVGATGYAGQELVRILARHPRVRLTAALGSASMEAAPQAAGPGPDLGRRGRCPTPRSASPPSVKAVFLALPEANAAETRARAAGARHPRHRPVGRLPPARRRGRAASAIRRRRPLPAGTRLRPGRARSRRRSPAAQLISCPGCYPTAALLALRPLEARRPARRRRHRRRQVGHLGRRQGADRAHALLREPRQRRRLRPVLAPPHARDGAGARRRR